MSPSVAKGLEVVRHDAAACQRCPLWQNATQTVFGEGPADADFVFVGEQPGDQEDRQGRPFVGPAGAIFDKALREASLDRARCYVTNAVKHFKNEPRGKRRLHKKPNVSEIKICRWWLEQEIALLRPKLTIALGATAAFSLVGRTVGIRAARGTVLQSDFAGPVFVTVHPSSLLRQVDSPSREREYRAFVTDLRRLNTFDQANEEVTRQPRFPARPAE